MSAVRQHQLSSQGSTGGASSHPVLPGPQLEAPPTWCNAREAVAVCVHRPNRRRIALIALVVGTLLVGINQGSVLAAGHVGWVIWVRVGLDYLIPTCVSTLGLLSGCPRRSGGEGTDAPRSG
ncbi:MAG TPA: nitrate/nitrite transporter NrtS [Candidatus Dormibacteraeota bacterium]|nr:nitrate/nitrite transporter NrtS [Candidatus Dormibacteraeota bacterium]